MQFFQFLGLLFASVATAQNITSCDNGGSEQACRCDDGNCYAIGADVDCNLPVGAMVNCTDFYDFSD